MCVGGCLCGVRAAHARHPSAQGLYRVPGSAQDVERLFTQWSSGGIKTLPTGLDPYLVASLVKKSFRDLATIEPLVPFESYDKFVDIANPSSDTSSQVYYLRVLLERLPDRNRKLLGALLKHLRTVSRHSDTNRMTNYNLSVCWAPNIICSREVTPRAAFEAPSVVRVFQLLLEHGERLLFEEAPVGAVGTVAALTTVPPVLDAALSYIETLSGGIDDPLLYANMRLPGDSRSGVGVAVGITTATTVAALKARCQAGELPDLRGHSPLVVSQLVLRFLEDTPRPLIPADALPALIRAVSRDGSEGRDGEGDDGSVAVIARRQPSREWHFGTVSTVATDASGGGSPAATAAVPVGAPTLTPAHRSAVSDMRGSPIAAGMQGHDRLMRRSSDPHGERWTGAAGSLSASKVRPQQSRSPMEAPDPEIEDAAIDAVRDCLDTSLGVQARNVLARLCAHLHAVFAQRARVAASGAADVPLGSLTSIADAFVYAVFRLGPVASSIHGPVAPGGAAATASSGAVAGGVQPRPATLTEGPQTRVLVRVLTFVVAHHARIFGE